MTDTIYNEVTYPSAVYAQTHPDRLAMMATLLGMTPAPVERCRVLELGCGDGWNVITMAYGLPGSEFTGIDLASEPIARGSALAAKLGLKNLSLREMDVADAADLGEFDYIIAHGLYSWVPEAVREKVMALCGRSLAANGVAYLSYNAYPGNHARDLVRGMMRYHTAHFADPQRKIAQARGLVKFLAESKQPRDLYHEMLAVHLEHMAKRPDEVILHDDLSAINQPFYFHEFMAGAAANGLQFLAEADMLDNRQRPYPPHVEAVLAKLDPEDIVAREQYRDFLENRAFRQTLLCRQGVRLERDIAPERVYAMHVAGELRAASPKPDFLSDTAEVFLGPKDAEIETARALIKVAFAKLGSLWPQCLSFRELLAHSVSALGRGSADEVAGDTANLAEALIHAHAAGFIEFRTRHANFTTEPGERPRASALARLQFLQGDRAPSLRHCLVEIRDAVGKAFVQLMDGTRDRAALLAELGALQPVTAEQLDENLRRLAHLGLVHE